MKKAKHTCCSIQGCEGNGFVNYNGTEVFPKGLCAKHYMRVMRKGTTDDPVPATCFSVSGCIGNGPYAKGLCTKHYSRYLRHGDIDCTKKRGRKPKTTTQV